MSVAIAVAPVVYAADQEPIRTAKAIGEESTTPPTAPKKTTEPTTPVPATPSEPAAEKPAEEATEPETVSKTAIYIGIGVAILLAAGGGGGGGGSSTPPHPQQ